MQQNKLHSHQLNATEAGPKPGDFPIGSLESRAAARAVFEGREAAGVPGVLLRITKIEEPVDPSKCNCKRPKAGTFAVCQCFMDEPDATIPAQQ